MYYILETIGYCGEVYHSNVVAFSESKENLDIKCKNLQECYNTDYKNWEIAFKYFEILKKLKDEAITKAYDKGLNLTIAGKNITIKFQKENPITNNDVLKFFYFDSDNTTIRSVRHCINDFTYKVKEIANPKNCLSDLNI